jgi:ElaB/YqjD/DUF883 family membrane-anchored ribosome-binding protein
LKNVIAAIRSSEKNQRVDINALLWRALSIEGISAKPEKKESSKETIKQAIANIETLIADAPAMKLLNKKTDASGELAEAKKKMQKLLEDLESDENFSTAGAVGSINNHIRNLRRF